ncbi:MAG: hypothetical protein IPG32_21645 [Saprospirales bacterium]|nr:hypothetical protein [Saprospirales bacterium]
MYKELMTLISQGEIRHTIELLLGFVDKHYTRFTPEVYLISSRFSQVSKENREGVLPHSDYTIEINSISKSLLDIVESIEGLSEENFKLKKNREEIMRAISELENRFDQSRTKAKTIQSNPTRLREKNEIARELGEIFINHPELIEPFYGTTSEGVITGIANRYKRLPELTGIDFFESIARNDMGNFTKCCIVNALAEIIYTGQLRIGDDQRISNILDSLFPNSFQTVKLSITRVSAELDYFLGNILSNN